MRRTLTIIVAAAVLLCACRGGGDDGRDAGGFCDSTVCDRACMVSGYSGGVCLDSECRCVGDGGYVDLVDAGDGSDAGDAGDAGGATVEEWLDTCVEVEHYFAECEGSEIPEGYDVRGECVIASEDFPTPACRRASINAMTCNMSTPCETTACDDVLDEAADICRSGE